MDYKWYGAENNIFIAYSKTTNIPQKWNTIACFAQCRGKNSGYIWYKPKPQNTIEVHRPYWDDVLPLFPGLSEPESGIFLFDLNNYKWASSEFLLAGTLLRNTEEYPYCVETYATIRKWGATPSQAFLLCGYYLPKTFEHDTISGNDYITANLFVGGHTLQSYSHFPKTAVGYDLKQLIEKVRKEENLGQIAAWSLQEKFLYSGESPNGEGSEKMKVITEQELQLLITPQKSPKENAKYYTL